jgi:hypothetical protein
MREREAACELEKVIGSSAATELSRCKDRAIGTERRSSCGVFAMPMMGGICRSYAARYHGQPLTTQPNEVSAKRLKSPYEFGVIGI